MTTYFFDSWGQLWTSCRAEHPAAEPFGPRAIARRATRQELHDLKLMPNDDDVTPKAVARKADRIDFATECHEWDLLK